MAHSAQLRIGIRQGLSAIMTTSLIFTAAGVPELSDMQLGSTWINLDQLGSTWINLAIEKSPLP